MQHIMCYILPMGPMRSWFFLIDCLFVILAIVLFLQKRTRQNKLARSPIALGAAMLAFAVTVYSIWPQAEIFCWVLFIAGLPIYLYGGWRLLRMPDNGKTIRLAEAEMVVEPIVEDYALTYQWIEDEGQRIQMDVSNQFLLASLRINNPPPGSFPSYYDPNKLC